MGQPNKRRGLKPFYEDYWHYRKKRGYIYNKKSFPARFSVILHLIRSNNNILDVGCGEALLSKMLIEQSNRVVGIDISEEAIKLAREDGVEALLCDVEKENLPFDYKSFDIIILSEIIEHLISPRDVLEKLKYYLKDGGFFIITFPNIGFYKYRLDLLRGHFPKQYLYDKSEHLHFWTIPDFVDFLASCHLKGLRIIPTYSFPFYQLILTLGPVMKLVKRFDNFLAYQIVILASPMKRHA